MDTLYFKLNINLFCVLNHNYEKDDKNILTQQKVINKLKLKRSDDPYEKRCIILVFYIMNHAKKILIS